MPTGLPTSAFVQAGTFQILAQYLEVHADIASHQLIVPAPADWTVGAGVCVGSAWVGVLPGEGERVGGDCCGALVEVLGLDDPVLDDPGLDVFDCDDPAGLVDVSVRSVPRDTCAGSEPAGVVGDGARIAVAPAVGRGAELVPGADVVAPGVVESGGAGVARYDVFAVSTVAVGEKLAPQLSTTAASTRHNGATMPAFFQRGSDSHQRTRIPPDTA